MVARQAGMVVVGPRRVDLGKGHRLSAPQKPECPGLAPASYHPPYSFQTRTKRRFSDRRRIRLDPSGAMTCSSPAMPPISTSWLMSLIASLVAATLSYASGGSMRSEEHTSELQSLMRISYAVFCLKKKNKINSTDTQQ